MPRTGVALFVRPNFDPATEFGYYYMGLSAVYASRRMFVRCLGDGDATRANIEAALDMDDPIFCYMLGHGNADTYTAQNQEVVMRTCSGDEALIGRVVLLLSCSTGRRLAPDAAQKGALAVFAWDVDFTWVADGPPPNPKAQGFFEAVNAISNALADGGTARDAMDLSLAAWSRWIDHWVGSDDPYAPLVVQHMLHNRDGQRLFGDVSARVTVPGVPPEAARVPLQIPILAGHAITMLGLIAP